MRVMRETGESLEAVVRAPYHRTLWIWAHAVGRDRREALIRGGDRLDLASAIALGFHEPKRLPELTRSHQAAIGLLPTVEESMTRSWALEAEFAPIIARLDAADRASAPDPAAAQTSAEDAS